MRAFAVAVLFGWLLWPACPAGASDKDPLTPDVVRERIRRHRTAAATLTVLAPGGKPLAGAAVVLRQTRHQFLFGSNAFGLDPTDDGPLQRAYQQRFAALLNYATLPFYWGAYEGRQGKPDAERLGRMARWCAEHGVSAKGHPLCWQEVSPPWLAGKTTEETLRLQLGRIRRDVAAFAGRIDVWDVVNEAVAMPTYAREKALPAVCKEVGTVALLEQAFAAAWVANPRAVLALNDYDTTAKYETLVRDALTAGVVIDVVGIQAHMHTHYWGRRHTWDTCERFARLGRPLHITEMTILAGPRKEKLDYHTRYTDWDGTPEGEKQQAERVEELYTVLFSHPAVQGITWWDFSDHGAWLGAPAGLLRKDMTPRPAYEALARLIKQQWWTGQVRATTDAAGRVTFRGYLGDYVVESPSGTGAFRLDRAGEVCVTAQVKPARP
jgi:GH35 family endo-1,4-beta-xylanase